MIHSYVMAMHISYVTLIVSCQALLMNVHVSCRGVMMLNLPSLNACIVM